MESPESFQILPRAAAAALERALSTNPVVALLGARQTGKTTLLRTLPALARRTYLTLDDFDLRNLARSDPESIVARAKELVIDEVQRAPDLLIAVKRSIDRDKRRAHGRIVLTGSANLLLLERLSDTLAGRAAYVTLWPFSRAERLGLGRTGRWSDLLAVSPDRWPDLLAQPMVQPEDWRSAVRLGGLPVPAHELKNDDQRSVWFSGYVQTYLERDLQALRAVENLADFRRLMRAACLRLGSLINQTELARDVGIAQPQVHRFLKLMEASYQLIRLAPYSVNRTKRLIKAPKLYWSDTALALHLSGEHEPRGPHLENLVLNDLIAWRDVEPTRPEVLYWRTTSGQEVDFVIETSRKLLPIEVKTSTRATTADIKGLEAFLDEYPDLAPAGLLLYNGQEIMPLSRRVLAAPWWTLC